MKNYDILCQLFLIRVEIYHYRFAYVRVTLSTGMHFSRLGTPVHNSLSHKYVIDLFYFFYVVIKFL